MHYALSVILSGVGVTECDARFSDADSVHLGRVGAAPRHFRNVLAQVRTFGIPAQRHLGKDPDPGYAFARQLVSPGFIQLAKEHNNNTSYS